MAILKLDLAAPAACAAVVRVGGGYHVVATEPIQPGRRVLLLEGEETFRRSRTTVQIDLATHLEVPAGTSLELALDRYPWRFLNHSCDPSACIRGREVLARRRIRPWDEVTFDYAATELDLAEPFPCRCGHPRCRGLIRGYRHLTPMERRRLRPQVAPYLLALEATGALATAMETTA